MTVTADGGVPNLRGLIGTAFAQDEPALPELDDVLGQIERLGGRIRKRQRVRTGIAAVALCASAFGMVSGISYLIHSSTTTQYTTVPGTGGDPDNGSPSGP